MTQSGHAITLKFSRWRYFGLVAHQNSRLSETRKHLSTRPNTSRLGAACSGILELLKNFKIAVIDDDVLVREGIESLLQSLHYEVDTFASAAEYLGCSRAYGYSCIVSDMQMPDMSGIDLQKRLLKDGFSIPIIFMSASPKEVLTRCVIDAGAVGFLYKPLKVESLIEYLGRALKRKSEEK